MLFWHAQGVRAAHSQLPCLPGRHRTSHGAQGCGRPGWRSRPPPRHAALIIRRHGLPAPRASLQLRSGVRGSGAAELRHCAHLTAGQTAGERLNSGLRAAGRHIPAICRPAAPSMPVLQRACNDAGGGTPPAGASGGASGGSERTQPRPCPRPSGHAAAHAACVPDPTSWPVVMRSARAQQLTAGCQSGLPDPAPGSGRRQPRRPPQARRRRALTAGSDPDPAARHGTAAAPPGPSAACTAPAAAWRCHPSPPPPG